MLVAFADFIGGFALWIDENGLLNHTYQYLGVDTYRQTSTTPVPTGDVTLKMLFEADESKPGTGGHVTLWADDTKIGEGEIPRTIALLSPPTRAWTSAATTAGWSTSTTRTGRPTPSREPCGTSCSTSRRHSHDDLVALHEATTQAAVAHGAAADTRTTPTHERTTA